MKKLFVGCLVLMALVMVALPTSPLAAATDTPTYTATWNNATRQAYATIPYAPACDPFNPCGALPWPIPRFPTVSLPTSTLYTVQPTSTAVPATTTPTETQTPSDTPTGAVNTPTITGGIDLGPVSTFADEFGDFGATLSVQTTAVVDINGTPTGLNEISAGLGASVGAPFALIKAVQSSVGTLGVLGTLLNFAFYSLLFVLFIYFLTVLLPFALFVVRILLQVITAVKPF